MKKRRVFWHTIKEVVPLVCILFFILTTLVFAQQFGKYSNLILSLQSSAEITQKLLLSFLPGIAVITLPVSLLLGTIITCSRSSSDNELTAWQSLGISQITLAKPFLAVGFAGTVITCVLSAYIAPGSLKIQKSLIAQIVLQEANTRIKPHTFITSFPGLLLYVQDVDPQTRDWLGVFLLQNDPEGSSKLLTAERGQFRIESGQLLTLEAQLLNGISLEYRGKPQPRPDPKQPALDLQLAPPSSQNTVIFTKYTVKLADHQDENDVDGGKETGYGQLAQMSLKEISRFAAQAKTDKERRLGISEMHKRFAFPFACLTLTAMTFILAIQGRRFSTRPRTVIAILFLAMGFYLLLVLGQNLALSGAIPGWLGGWLSNLIFGAFIFVSFISNKPPGAKLLALIGSPSSAGSGGAVSESSTPDATRRDVKTKPSKGSRVISLNLINYLQISEVIKYFALAALALVATITIFTLFDLIPSIIKNGTSLPYAASYLAYFTPQILYQVAPFSLLVALLMGFNVLSRSNQLVVIAAAGQSRARIVTAVIATASVLSVSLWALSNYVLPHTNREQDRRYSAIKGRQTEQTTIAFGRKWVFDKNSRIYSYQRMDPDDSLVNASVYQLDESQGLIRSATHFARATKASASAWRVDSGWIETINPDSTVERKAIQSQPEIINIAEGEGLFRRVTNESSKMSDAELQEHITQLENLGVSTLELRIDLKRRLAFPLSCMVLSILAIPFISAKQARRSGPLVSVSISVGIGLVFRVLAELFEAIGKQNNLPMEMAVWGPHILFGAVGLYLNFVRHRLQ